MIYCAQLLSQFVFSMILRSCLLRTFHELTSPCPLKNLKTSALCREARRYFGITIPTLKLRWHSLYRKRLHAAACTQGQTSTSWHQVGERCPIPLTAVARERFGLRSGALFMARSHSTLGMPPFKLHESPDPTI